jgi:hypothetical protein
MSTKAKYSDNAGRAGVLRPVARRDARVGEAAILQLVSEQRVVTVGQLARLLRTGPAKARHRVGRLVDLGWVATGSFPGFEGEWVWLRGRGYTLAGVRPNYKPVGVVNLFHTHAITEARLALREEYPDGVWVCEREFLAGRAESGVVPDGVLELGDRRLAIEVELSYKRPAERRGILARRCAAFDEVVYFIGPGVRKGVEEALADIEGAPVVFREIPGPRRGLCGAPADRRVFEPTAEELPALRLITEEGLVAVDQLGMLLGSDSDAGIALARRLEERNFVRREFVVGDDLGWLRVTGRTARLAGTGLEAPRVESPVSLGRRLVLARVRADWCSRPGKRAWITRRMLVKGLSGPSCADVPAAAAEAGSRSFAVVVVDRHVSVSRRRRDLLRFSKAYDGVVCVSDEFTLPWVRRYVAEKGLGNVEIEAVA